MLKELINQKKLIIFDLDDTIMYTFQNGYKKLIYVEQKLDIPITSFNFFQSVYGKISFEECIQKMHPELDIRLFLAEYYNAAECIPYCAVMDLNILLDKMKKRNIEVGIITNSEGYEKVLKKITFVGINPQKFIFIYTGDILTEKKPSARAFSGIKELKRFKKKEILYIADNESDWEFSKNIGMDFIAVGTGPYKWKKGETPYYLESIRDLEMLL